MSENDKDTMLDGLSKSVTALCAAIDPKHTHGPETEKIVAHERQIRETARDMIGSIRIHCGMNSQYGYLREWAERLAKLLDE